MVIYPVVPKGDILLRLIPTSMHNLDDVKETIAAFTECRDETGGRRVQIGYFPGYLRIACVNARLGWS